MAPKLSAKQRAAWKKLPKSKKGSKAHLKKTTQLVNKILNKKLETKLATYKVEDNVAHNSGIGPSDCYRICPALPNGDEMYQRLGDTVQPMKLVVNGYIAIDRNNAPDNRPLQVRVLALGMVQAKRFSTVQTTFATNYAHLLRINSETGTTVAQYTGNVQDNLYPINNREFRVYGQRLLDMTPNTLEQAGAPAPGSVESGHMVVRHFRFVIPTPKTLKFEDESGDNTPTNFAPFLSVGYQYMDGGGPDIIQTRIIVNAVSHLTYKDA